MIEHKTVSLSEQVFEQLERSIITGEYAKGEVFTEMNLAEQLKVSRTPIREALRRLEQEHLIEMSTKGAVIVGISENDICDMYEIRIRIEGLAARWAAENINEDGIKELCDIVELQEFYTQKSNTTNIKNMDSKFHETVYRLSGSNALFDTLFPLYIKTVKFRNILMENNKRVSHSAEEHRKICDAIISKDADLAEQLMIQHVKNAGKSILKSIR